MPAVKLTDDLSVNPAEVTQLAAFSENRRQKIPARVILQLREGAPRFFYPEAGETVLHTLKRLTDRLVAPTPGA